MTYQNSRVQMKPLFASKTDDKCTRHPPGSIGWIMEKRILNPTILIDTDSYWNSLSGEEQEKLTTVLRGMRFPCLELQKNRELVRNITRWTNGNEWMIIEGGEHNRKWVNPRYPSEIFESGKLRDLNTNTDLYFPLGNSLSDPEGIACHFEINVAGTQCSVIPNKWTEASSLRYHYRPRRRAHRRECKQYLYEQGLDDLAKYARAENVIAKTVKKMKQNH